MNSKLETIMHFFDSYLIFIIFYSFYTFFWFYSLLIFLFIVNVTYPNLIDRKSFIIKTKRLLYIFFSWKGFVGLWIVLDTLLLLILDIFLHMIILPILEFLINFDTMWGLKLIRFLIYTTDTPGFNLQKASLIVKFITILLCSQKEEPMDSQEILLEDLIQSSAWIFQVRWLLV